ncbi:DUF3054 family protein [Agromyces sp. MMS17-SY077]|uniref:DUF3054 family protein n=1 Tax=Agromyces seonyuensis TaxID=2662446 RepID=A0A6I4P349_9MICO|nr:DUF3054 family protein [Agromyces seonyuensis]
MVGAAAFDLVLVAVFVVIGRASHDEDPIIGMLVTLWPFAVGLAIGWVATRAWRRPAALVRTGLPVWVATVAIGMLLRAASGQGTAVAFVVVATVALALFLLGWRGIAALVARRSVRRAP